MIIRAVTRKREDLTDEARCEVCWERADAYIYAAKSAKPGKAEITKRAMGALLICDLCIGELERSKLYR
jgi:hypothetical protein